MKKVYFDPTVVFREKREYVIHFQRLLVPTWVDLVGFSIVFGERNMEPRFLMEFYEFLMELWSANVVHM